MQLVLIVYIYITAKETVQEFFADSNMTDTDKANILSQMLVSMTTSLTAQAMTAAISIAQQNRDGDHLVTKMGEETKLVQEFVQFLHNKNTK